MSHVQRSKMNPDAKFIEKKRWSKFLKDFEVLLNNILDERKVKKSKKIKYILNKDDLKELEYYLLFDFNNLSRTELKLNETVNDVEYKFSDEFQRYMDILSFEIGSIREFYRNEYFDSFSKKHVEYVLEEYNIFKIHYILKKIRMNSIKIILTD